MSGELLLIVDDASSAVSHGGGQWSTNIYSGWYSGSCTWPEFAVGSSGDSGVYGSLNYTFSGTSIAFVGNTPPSKDTQTVTVTIDEGLPYNASYDDPNPQNYRQWYQSPHLGDGVHTIQLDGIAGTSVDFMIVSAGPSTPFTGQKVIMDDDDPSIVYSGNWTRSESPFVSSEAPNGSPFHNGTHQSTTLGDTAIIHFTGTSIALYGIFSWAALGSMAATYTLDDSSSVISYNVGPSTPEFTSHILEHQNYLLYSNDSFAPGDHTLVINLTEVVNLTFMMDYLTYSPSFASLATKPNLTTPLTSTSSNSPPPTSMATGSSTARPAPSSNAPNIGGIVGGITGVVIILLLALLIIHNRMRRQAVRVAGLESGHQESGISPYLLTASSFTGDDKSGSSINGVIAASSHPNSQEKHTITPSLTASDPQRGTASLQVDPLQRIRAAGALMGELEASPSNDGVSQGGEIQIRHLRQRIADLTRDQSLSRTAPPAYDPGT